MSWRSTMTVFQVFKCGSFQIAKTFQVYQLSKCDSTKVQLLPKCSSFLNVKAFKLHVAFLLPNVKAHKFNSLQAFI
jgi:hypothetical protein